MPDAFFVPITWFIFVARLELSSLELCSGSKQYRVIENCSADAILEFWQHNDVKNLPWDILQINMVASEFFKLHFDGLADLKKYTNYKPLKHLKGISN